MNNKQNKKEPGSPFRRHSYGLVLLLLAWLSLLPCTASGTGDRLLFEESDFLVKLISCQADSGNVCLDLSLESRKMEEVSFGVISPEIDGDFAWIANPEAEEPLPVLPGEIKHLTFLLEGDRAFDDPEEVSLYFLLDDRITTQAILRLKDHTVEPATETADQPAVSPQIQYEDPDIPPVTFRDQIPKMPEPPEYVSALVFLREEDSLRQLAELPVEIHESGEATAVFSNQAMALNPEDPFLITCNEITTDTGTVWTTNRIGLFSDAIYFATLSLTIHREPGGSPGLAYQLEAEEFGTVSIAPLDLFQGGTALSLVYRVEDGEPVSAGSVSKSLQLDNPLQFALLPARDLGTIVCCFVYDYPDGTSVFHISDETGL